MISLFVYTSQSYGTSPAIWEWNQSFTCHPTLVNAPCRGGAMGGGAFRAIPPRRRSSPPSPLPLNLDRTHARTQPSDDEGRFSQIVDPFPCPLPSPSFTSRPIPSPLPSIAFTPSPLLPSIPFFPLPFSSLPFFYPLFLPIPPPPSPPFSFLSSPFSPPLIFPPSPPVRSRPLKSSYDVWRSAVSSLSGVWGRAPAEVQFDAF